MIKLENPIKGIYGISNVFRELGKFQMEIDKKTSQGRKEGDLASFFELEAVLNKLFKELQLKAGQIQLLRAFVEASKGKAEFEVSYSDLGKILYKADGLSTKKIYDRVKYAHKMLEKWQQENQITLIQLLSKGERIKTDDNRFEYSKSKYRFIFLEEFVSAFHNHSDNFEEIVQKTIKNLREQFVSAEKPPKYHPRHNMKKAKNTIITKLRRAFELAQQVGDDPVDYCQGILNEAWKVLDELVVDFTYENNRGNFIKEFEDKIKSEYKELFSEGS